MAAMVSSQPGVALPVAGAPAGAAQPGAGAAGVPGAFDAALAVLLAPAVAPGPAAAPGQPASTTVAALTQAAGDPAPAAGAPAKDGANHGANHGAKGAGAQRDPLPAASDLLGQGWPVTMGPAVTVPQPNSSVLQCGSQGSPTPAAPRPGMPSGLVAVSTTLPGGPGRAVGMQQAGELQPAGTSAPATVPAPGTRVAPGTTPTAPAASTAASTPTAVPAGVVTVATSPVAAAATAPPAGRPSPAGALTADAATAQPGAQTVPALGVPLHAEVAAPHTVSAPTAPPAQPTFGQQLAAPVLRLVTGASGEHVLTVRVAPDHLGPVTVQAHIDADGVRIELFSPTEAGRAAVQAALPDLRRDLAGAGLGASLDLSHRDAPAGQPAPGGHPGHPGDPGQRRDGQAPTGTSSGAEPPTRAAAASRAQTSTPSLQPLSPSLAVLDVLA